MIYCIVFIYVYSFVLFPRNISTELGEGGGVFFHLLASEVVLFGLL